MNMQVLWRLFAAAGIMLTLPAQADDTKNLVVALRGAAIGQVRPVPRTPQGSTQASCFDLQLVDVRKGEVIGTATDCLSDFTPEGNGTSLTATTIFHFREGTLVSRGRTTVQPVSPTAAPSPATHITGSIPAPGSNEVLSGDGRFRGKAATVRLSGAVDLSQLANANKIAFDCIFVIDFL
jgi:hypothetical protein